MELVITLIGAIMAVFIVILIHEAGHFAVAKAFGVKVLRFSIGFGKPLWKYISRSGTEYVVAILPLGGYVKMLDDRDMHVSAVDSRCAYNQQPLLARMAIVLAGPLTNFLLAIVVFWVIFLQGVVYIKPVIGKITPQSIAAAAGLQAGDTIQAIDDQAVHSWQQVVTTLVKKMGDKQAVKILTQPAGNSTPQMHELFLQDWKLAGSQPDPLSTIGIIPFQPAFPAIVKKVELSSPAARNGIQAGDQIIAINHQAVADWPAVAEYIHQHPNQEITLTIKQAEAVRDLNIQLDSKINKGQRTGYIGIHAKMPEWAEAMLDKTQHSVITAWAPAWRQAWEFTIFNGIVLEKMFLGKISVETLGGPITVFRSAGQASQAGLQAYLSFIGFISVTLGFINILPIPGLDGGHFLFQVIESIIGRPVSEKWQAIWLRVGILVIILLIVQGTINDVLRLFLT